MILTEGWLATVQHAGGALGGVVNLWTCPPNAAFADVALTMQATGGFNGYDIFVEDQTVIASPGANTQGNGRLRVNTTSRVFRVPANCTVRVRNMTNSAPAVYFQLYGTVHQQVAGSNYRFSRRGLSATGNTGITTPTLLYEAPSDIRFATARIMAQEYGQTSAGAYIQRANATQMSALYSGTRPFRLGMDVPFIDPFHVLSPGDKIYGVCAGNTSVVIPANYTNGLDVEIHETLIG